MSPSRRTAKFDGHQYRQLTAAELGQIAGRAGRHVRDGTFWRNPARSIPFPTRSSSASRATLFEPVKVLQWRTADLDFASLEALRASIDAIPPVEGLTRALPATDAQALERLTQDAAIRQAASGRRKRAAVVGRLRATGLSPHRAGSAFRSHRFPLPRSGRQGPSRRELSGRTGAACRFRRGRYSTRSRSASPRSEHGLMSRIGPDGWPIRHIGKEKNARYRRQIVGCVA